MNSPTTELNKTQSKQEYIGTDDYNTEMDRMVYPGPEGPPVWAGPPSDVCLPGLLPDLYQYHMQAGMLDPLGLRFQCPYQSTQCQMTYPICPLEQHPNQHHLLPGPLWVGTDMFGMVRCPGILHLLSTVPGPLNCSFRSSFSAPWLPNEPIFCKMMPGYLHTPFASVCVPQAMDHQLAQEGLNEVPRHITQPVVRNVSGGGHALLVNPCEPGPELLTLDSTPAWRDDELAQGRESSMSGCPNQMPQHRYQYQTVSPLYESRDQLAHVQPQVPPVWSVRTSCESKFKKSCHCTKSRCLKLYCECFANGVMCINCDCSNCYNNAEHEILRDKAVKSCLGRNPEAFRTKIAGATLGEVQGWHNRGCNCKRSSCLKNYCECYEANIRCTSSCRCVGCRNYDNGSEMGLKEKTVEEKSAISVAMVETVCSCLLVKAEEAEREDQNLVQVERMVLNEFGHCLAQIVATIMKYNTH